MITDIVAYSTLNTCIHTSLIALTKSTTIRMLMMSVYAEMRRSGLAMSTAWSMIAASRIPSIPNDRTKALMERFLMNSRRKTKIASTR